MSSLQIGIVGPVPHQNLRGVVRNQIVELQVFGADCEPEA